MNWYTKTYIGKISNVRKQELFDMDGGCEHCEADISKADYLRKENDSFGTVSSWVCCSECDTKADEAEDEEEEVCFDCKKTVKMKDAVEWRWYDFYAPQGDEPLIICNECRTKEKHLDRVRKDREDYEEEMARYDD